MSKKLMALLTASFLVLSVFASAPVMASSPGKAKLVLTQSHQFDGLVPEGGLKSTFGGEREKTTGNLTITFAKPILELAGRDNVALEFFLTVPGMEDLQADLTVISTRCVLSGTEGVGGNGRSHRTIWIANFDLVG